MNNMKGYKKPEPITSEEQYFEYLERVRKGAEFLDNPLIKPEDYKRGLKRYDDLCQRVLEYRGMTS